MTAQEIFNKVYCHLMTQRERSVDSKGDCLYRLDVGGKTLKCAIGCLIPDGLYRDNMEYRTIYFLLGAFPKLQDYIPLQHLRLLGRLQQIHDEYSPEIWEEELIEIAEIFGLEVPALTK